MGIFYIKARYMDYIGIINGDYIGEYMGYEMVIPSGYVKIAIENGPVEIVDFPMKN